MIEVLAGIDGGILLWLQENIRFESLTPIMREISNLGNTAFIWLLAGVLCLCFKKTRKAGILVFGALLCSLIINNLILKTMIARIRPYEVVSGLVALIPGPPDFSFPSGHAGSSFAAAVVIFKECKKPYGIAALLLASMISFTRLYLGVHYPSDVLAGVLIGTLIAFALCWIADRLKKAADARKRKNRNS